MHADLAHREPAALFIRGRDEVCVMWHQRAAEAPGEPVFWDYHVVVLVKRPWEIYDLDTTLGCPVAAKTYLRRSFRPELALPPELGPRFRLVDAASLASTFVSDRSHMRGPDGTYREPQPPWPAIGSGSSTLARFLAHDDAIAGEELGLPALLRRVLAGRPAIAGILSPVPRKIIFLDIDGVMNSVNTRPPDPRGLVDFLDPRNVSVLNAIVQATGAVVVVSSSWRLSMSFAALQASFAAAGCVAELIDVTPEIDGRRRVLEVVAWLERQAEPPAQFVVLDDEFDMPAFPQRLVRTSKQYGLSPRDLPAVLAILAG